VPSNPETTERLFPIMDGDQRSWIPWRVIAPHEAQARRNHGQSLGRLAERGGLNWTEAWGVLNGVGWSRLPKRQEAQCKAAVLAICAKEPASHE
jgi:hypothetical protein